ncbi:MAG TPA: RNA polymerase subunit sigma-24 [Planctomycetaceae bacterium]|nr:RNA polymerase subunit sigma-24 [Planctomycetaceae bacterium]
MANDAKPPSSAGGGRFMTTHWSLVLAAADCEASHGREALASLCQIYWYPLYAFVRRQGHGPQDAQDLTQEFFLRLLEKDYLGDVDRSKGKFRSFLLVAMKHFLSNQWAREKTLKRGGGRAFVPLDAISAEDRYRREPHDDETPERLFERRWALTLLDQVLTRLGEEYATTGRRALFEQLRGCLAGDSASLPYADLAARIGMSEGAVKVAVHRLRRRYRGVLRDEIAKTVAHVAEIDDEIGQLFSALGQ